MAVEKDRKVDHVIVKQRNIVLVGIRIDESGKEILKWALEEVAEHGDCVVVVHVCFTSYRALKSKSSLDRYLNLYSEFCSTKKIELKGEVLKGNSVLGVLLKEAKKYNAMSVVVGVKPQRKLSLKIAKGCAKELPSTTDVLAIHRGSIVFRRSNHYQLPLDKESELKSEKLTVKRKELAKTTGQEKRKISGRSLSLPSVEIVDQTPGWPLLRTTTLATPMVQHRKISVVNWVMSLPERFPHHPNLTSQPSFFDKQLKDILKEINRWFSYDVLKIATSNFSSENLIGKGGCNEVYKGFLEDGKAVAVKILRPSVKEAVKEFVHEVRIISSLSHSNISPLIGVCVHYNDLISVYNLSSKGSLEETLQGKHVLRWEERFKIAIGLGEALDYLHNQCSNPVIHRDVKSSNILLSDEFEPQLSDFGLSMWGSKSCPYTISRDVVGTFGYLAPEYFMYGKVSDKVDVYAFGVVLLELISGRTSISSDSPRGQESLVMWAKPMIEKGNAKELLDPNISGTFDEDQFHKMVLAATHCLTRAATYRPNIREILKLLRGEDDVSKWVKIVEEDEDCFDDEVYPNSNIELHLSLAMIDVEDNDSVSISSLERSNNSLFSSSSSQELQS
ncbi:Protein kinase domain [Arabidopsis thaliana x Arabidopsis arenosa]|uniref:Protein kinase domain n=1 Tax=Arabidopsis thaliana x Arabidopsis arenosa TaxID=1240361 RepID=A0A8T2B0S4_9BRAS|nr:Protein kinase domain [Arabidopsis thaliana x Arabidopsis arenosa]KAG7579390.1 Protein kinase domain [Arabidopsis thaliana x Arabidopsis arenosa]KAG7579391.1 Protein kinase domain [Arabidopsis thaliana x Arabidopsis arenosa]